MIDLKKTSQKLFKIRVARGRGPAGQSPPPYHVPKFPNSPRPRQNSSPPTGYYNSDNACKCKQLQTNNFNFIKQKKDYMDTGR